VDLFTYLVDILLIDNNKQFGNGFYLFLIIIRKSLITLKKAKSTSGNFAF